MLLPSGSPQAHKPAGRTAAARRGQQGAQLLPAATSDKMLKPGTTRGQGLRKGRAQGLSQPIPDLPQPLSCRQHAEGLAGRAAGERPPAAVPEQLSQYRDSDRLPHHGIGAIETTQFLEAKDFFSPPQKNNPLNSHIFSLYCIYIIYRHNFLVNIYKIL